MKSHLVLLVLVGLVYASENPAWEKNKVYTYLVKGLSLASLHEVSDQYSGIYIEAKLRITPLNNGNLQANILDAQHAQIRNRLPDGWDNFDPQPEWLNKLRISNKPFQIVMSNGLITGLRVDEKLPNWEINLIKGIVTNFQMDVQGQKLIDSPKNILPREDRFDGMFKTMEETVTGETETRYDIQPFPEYLLMLQPWLAPKFKLQDNVPITEIIKNKNFTNGVKKPSCYFGFGGLTEGHPTSNRMGTFFSRQSNSRAIVTGTFSKFIIRSISSMDKIVINPTIDAKEQGSVVSSFNITFIDVTPLSKIPEELKLIDIDDLIYTWEEASESHYSGRPGARKRMAYSMDRDSSDSSEETTQYQPMQEMCEPLQIPLPPYLQPNNIDLPQNAKKIAQEISEEMQHPEKILTEATLSKYVRLSSLVRMMNQKEIESVTSELYTKSEGPKRLSWLAFRDAVAEAGTYPSLENIHQWIISNKIEKREASEVVAALSYATRFPTKEYMTKFLEMVKDPQVYSQELVNETSILAYTHLLNKAYVNRNFSYDEYPIHSFKGVDTSEERQAVSEVVSDLAEQLNNAVDQGDTRKIHVFIRALGNLGDKKILKVYKPFLEGKKQVSQFQRLLMVLSMDKLVESDPSSARSVLYNIYKNTAELPEIRVVAVGHIIKTNPPVEMLQRMAENTNTDPQEHVNAAVKSAIKTLSYLKSPESQQIRTAARAAEPLLTDQEYGTKYSFKVLQQYVTENMDLELTHNILQVGSTDSRLPKGIKYQAYRNMNGMKDHIFNAHAMVSSVKELTRVFYKQTDQDLCTKQGESTTSHKIAKLLDLDIEEREQLEGFIFTHMQRLWSFDNQTLEQHLPERIREEEEKLRDGKQFNYNKLQKQKEMTLFLPTALGFPFWYTYDSPLFIQVQGNISAKAKPTISRLKYKISQPDTVNAELDLSVTFSSKVLSQLKIVTPFDQQEYIAGIARNIHTYVPLKADVEVYVKNLTAKIDFEVKETDKNVRFLHYSSWPFTSKTKLLDLNPVALDPNTHIIRPEGHRSFDFSFGRNQTGMDFRVWGHHPQQTKHVLQYLDLLKAGDINTILQQVWDESSLQQTDVSVALMSDLTSTYKFSVFLSNQEKYQRKPEKPEQEKFRPIDEWSSTVPEDSEQRHEHMMKFVGSGINNAKIKSYDAFFEFENDVTYKHTFTLATAKSNAHPLYRFVALYKGAGKYTAASVIDVKGSVPNPNELNFPYAKSHRPKASYEIQFQHNHQNEQTTKVETNIEFSRTEQRKQYLEKQPLYKVCKYQMGEGNYQLSACRNMTIESNYFDEINVEVEYENLNEKYERFMKSAFEGVRFLYYHKTETNSTESEEENKLKMVVRFEPENLRKVNVTVKFEDEVTKFINFSVSDMAKTLFVSHPLYEVQTRFLGYLRGQENIRPYCIVDKNDVQTFSNLTYPNTLSKVPTVMMLYVPQVARMTGHDSPSISEVLTNQHEHFVVTVREESEEQNEVELVFRHSKTECKDVKITLKPKQKGSMPSVLFNGQEVSFTEKEAAGYYNGTVEIYALPNNEVKVVIEHWFYMLYDGERVAVTDTNGKLRDSVVGLCGRFSEDKWEDLTVPDSCVISNAETFVRKWKVQQPEPEITGLNILESCKPKVLPKYVQVVPDQSDDRLDRSWPIRSGSMRSRVRYVIDSAENEICFTTNPLPVCDDQIVGASVSKEVPVHCLPMTKTAMYIKKQIDMGGNPDLSHKRITRRVKMEIPISC